VRLSMRSITFFLFLLIGYAGIPGNVMGHATNAAPKFGFLLLSRST